MKDEIEKIWMQLKNKKNVVGHSGSFRNRIIDGKEIDGTSVFRVYVSTKVPLESLEEDDIIPEFICGVEIDVVEIGEVKALNS